MKVNNGKEMSSPNYFVLNKRKNKITMTLSLFNVHFTPLLSLACNTSPINRFGQHVYILVATIQIM